MYGLMGQVAGLLPAGSILEWPIQFSAGNLDAADIEGCLYGTGAFDDVQVSGTAHFFGNPTIVIRVQTAIDFSTPGDVSSLVGGTIYSCDNGASHWRQLESVNLVYVAPKPGYEGLLAQQTPQGTTVPDNPLYDNLINPGDNPLQRLLDYLSGNVNVEHASQDKKDDKVPDPKACGWDLLCHLGIKPGASAGIGLVGGLALALIGVVLVKRVL